MYCKEPILIKLKPRKYYNLHYLEATSIRELFYEKQH